MKKIIDYFKGVKKEISRIKWTSKKDLLKYSVASILFVMFFGVFFYGVYMLVSLFISYPIIVLSSIFRPVFLSKSDKILQVLRVGFSILLS